MCSSFSIPGDIHTAIQYIQQLPKDFLTDAHIKSSLQRADIFHAMQTIFSYSTTNNLSQEERKTVERLYNDISRIPCRLCPDLVKNIIAYRIPSSPYSAPEEDPLLQSWQKEPHNSSKYEAHSRIMSHVQTMRQMQCFQQPNQEIPVLDLSQLGLTELPSCLLQNPIFAKTNISDNQCAKYPENLPMGSIRNIKLYQEMQKQIESNPKYIVSHNADLFGYISSYLEPKDTRALSLVNQASQEGYQRSSIERLQQIRETKGHLLNNDLQDRLTKALEINVLPEHSLELTQIQTTPKERSQLERDISIFLEGTKARDWLQQLHNIDPTLQDHDVSNLSPIECIQLKKETFDRLEKENLVQAWPSILPQLSETTQAIWNEYLYHNPSATNDANLVLDFMKENQNHFTQITTLDISSKNLSIVPAGMSYFANIKLLTLNDNQITDISSLSKLTQLQQLNVSNNHINDMSPIAHLTQLTTIGLSNNQIHDATFLTHLTQLTGLDLSDNPITDISPIISLIKLRYLYLNNTSITNISSLNSLSQIVYLELINSSITDISPLAPLTMLQQLFLYNNSITDISSLANLTKIITLDLGNNQLFDISSLANMVHLQHLNLVDNQITDASPLAALTNLQYLCLDNNHLTEISSLANLTKIITLTIRNNQLVDISPLVTMIDMQHLDLVDNQIIDASPLANLTQLQRLNLSGNPIADTSVLNDLHAVIHW